MKYIEFFLATYIHMYVLYIGFLLDLDVLWILFEPCWLVTHIFQWYITGAGAIA